MKCPRCNKTIRPEDEKCKNCGRDLTDLEDREYYGRETRGQDNSALTLVLWLLGGLLLIGLLGLLYYKMATAGEKETSTEQPTTETVTVSEKQTEEVTERITTRNTEQPTTEALTEGDTSIVGGGGESTGYPKTVEELKEMKLVDQKPFYYYDLEQMGYDLKVAEVICHALEDKLIYGTPAEIELLTKHPGRVYSLDEELKDETIKGWILDALETDTLPTPAYTKDKATRFSFMYEYDTIQVYAGTKETKDAWKLCPEVAFEYMEAVQ